MTVFSGNLLKFVKAQALPTPRLPNAGPVALKSLGAVWVSSGLRGPAAAVRIKGLQGES